MYPDYNISILDSQNDYNGLIDVEINLVKYPDEYVNYTEKYDNRKSNLMKVCGGKEIGRK